MIDLSTTGKCPKCGSDDSDALTVETYYYCQSCRELFRYFTPLPPPCKECGSNLTKWLPAPANDYYQCYSCDQTFSAK